MYRHYVVETYRAVGEPSGASIRARPLAGQGLETRMNVECSNSMRRKHPIGTKLKIKATITSREGGPSFLYTHHSWRYEVLSDVEAAAFIKSQFA